MRQVFVDFIFKKIENNKKVILLTADLGFGIFDRFLKFKNSQFFNVGVSEQLMASMAAGLSSEGFEVYIYSIGIFPTMRCLEQIRNDISYHEFNVTIITSGAGFSYGALGMSHHCVQDIAIMQSIPGIKVISPANDSEMKAALESKIKLKYIRICKSEFKLRPLSKINSIDIPICYREEINLKKNKKLIICHGTIAEITRPLIDKNYHFDLYTYPTLIETDLLIKLLENYTSVIAIEEHSEVNGFCNFLAFLILKNNLKLEFKYLALPHSHCSIVGDQRYLRNSQGLSSTQLEKLL